MPTRHRTQPATRRIACAMRLVMTLAITLLAHRALAQGTRGQLPDPITGMRLMIYADMLNLSPQQEHALDELHAAYRGEFQKLREGEIDAWLQIRGRPQTRAFVATKKRLLERIAAIDNHLFDSMIAILTDDQNGRLIRVRTMRQRERAMQVDGVWSWKDAPPVYLSQVIGQMALSADQMQDIDQELAKYESALTVRIEAFVEGYFKNLDHCLDAWEQAGWTPERRADDANFDAYYAVIKPISNADAARKHAMMSDVVSLNQRTLKSLKSQLPPTTWQQVRKSFLSSTYSNLHFLNQTPMLINMPSPFEKALAGKDLSEADRTDLELREAAFELDVDAAFAALIPPIDAYRETFAGDHDRQAEFDARNALDRQVSDAWDALVKRRNEEREHIAALIGKEPEQPMEELDPSTADLTMARVDGLIFEKQGMTGWFPSPISIRDLVAYGRWMKLDSARISKLQGVHARYLAEHDLRKKEVRTSIRDASAALHAGDSMEGYTRSNLKHMREVRSAVERVQRSVEEVFFDEIASALDLEPDDAGLLRARLARERQWLNGGSGRSDLMPEGNRHDGVFDLERVLTRIRDVDLGEPAIDQILCEYEQAYMPLVIAQNTAMRSYSDQDDDLRVEWQELRVATGEKYPGMTARYEELGMPAKKVAAIRTCDPIAELNQATVKRLCEVMPPAEAERVRRAFERLSWPRIYGDQSAAGSLLGTALALDDLTTDQRGKVEQIAAEYRPVYDAMCEKMKSMVEQKGSWAYDQEHASDEQRRGNMQRMSDRQRVLFERHELNIRAWRQLKGVLTEEQAQAINIGAMPPEGPTEGSDFGW